MKIRILKTGLLILLIVSYADLAKAQGVDVSEPLKTLNSNAIRVIRDPHTASRWLLERDPARPGGPGRMVLLSLEDGRQFESAKVVGGISNGTVRANRILPGPVIRSGDRLVVEENSALVEARLEAVALGQAVEGAEFRVRLAIGGRIVKAVAIGRGRASLAADAGRP